MPRPHLVVLAVVLVLLSAAAVCAADLTPDAAYALVVREPGAVRWVFATASIDRVDDVNVLSKMSLASDGRKAYEKAIELDPNYVAARVGVTQFYLNAPSIAGGSVEKLGREDDARKNYEEYAKRFPDDPRAKDAKATIKRLSGS